MVIFPSHFSQMPFSFVYFVCTHRIILGGIVDGRQAMFSIVFMVCIRIHFIQHIFVLYYCFILKQTKYKLRSAKSDSRLVNTQKKGFHWNHLFFEQSLNALSLLLNFKIRYIFRNRNVTPNRRAVP